MICPACRRPVPIEAAHVEGNGFTCTPGEDPALAVAVSRGLLFAAEVPLMVTVAAPMPLGARMLDAFGGDLLARRLDIMLSDAQVLEARMHLDHAGISYAKLGFSARGIAAARP